MHLLYLIWSYLAFQFNSWTIFFCFVVRSEVTLLDWKQFVECFENWAIRYQHNKLIERQAIEIIQNCQYSKQKICERRKKWHQNEWRQKMRKRAIKGMKGIFQINFWNSWSFWMKMEWYLEGNGILQQGKKQKNVKIQLILWHRWCEPTNVRVSHAFENE